MTFEQFKEWKLRNRDLTNKAADPEQDQQCIEVSFRFFANQFTAEELYRIVCSASDNRDRFDYEYLPGYDVYLDGDQICHN